MQTDRTSSSDDGDADEDDEQLWREALLSAERGGDSSDQVGEEYYDDDGSRFATEIQQMVSTSPSSSLGASHHRLSSFRQVSNARR